MDEDRFLRRKWTLRAHGQKVIFAKSPREKSEHVYMKILLWGLYLPIYPVMLVETRIGDRYKPDVVSPNDLGEPLFWGESGQVSLEKIQRLAKRYPHTHFAIGKWHQPLAPHIEIVEKAIRGMKRTQPFDLIRFPDDALERFVDADGNVIIEFKDVERIQVR